MNILNNTVSVKVQTIIRDRFGLMIHAHQLEDLDKIILKACQKFQCTPEEYSKKLLIYPTDSPLIEDIILNITVGESYFFRDQNQMQLLQTKILPMIINQKRKQQNLSLRIWSAGCSSGEEIYSIAMLLSEILPDKENWSFHLLGTDINSVALKKAMEGQYTEWSMRSIPRKYKQKYFLHNYQYELISDIREMVFFSYLNLNDDTYPSLLNGTNAQDLILCRNVLIYFDAESASHLMQKISASLIKDAYLLLGASDPIYLKKTDLIPHPAHSLLFMKHSKIKSFPTNTNKPKKLINHLSNDSQVSVKEPAKIVSSKSLNESASKLADLGKLEEALLVCRNSLTLDATNKQTYFILAMILIELDQITEAEKALRQALFLDHQYVMGHFQLGLLLFKRKNYSSGLKSLQNALNIAANKNPSKFVRGFHDLHYGKLTEILKKEIELHKVKEDK